MKSTITKRKNDNMKRFILAVGLLSASMAAKAKVVLPQFFTDSMVVQQLSVLTIPGTTKSGATVSVTTSWNNKTYKTTADSEGKFTVKVNTPKAGGPYQITVDDGEPTVLRDILSGEVWMCSGQSNMEMPVMGWGHVLNCEQEKANANYPKIRLLQIKRITSYKPENNTEVNMGGWRRCAPETVDNFSALAYFYARELHKKLNVPVGVIDCSWGGTPAESWTTLEGNKAVGGFEKYIDIYEKNNFDGNAIAASYKAALDNVQNNIDQAVRNANQNIFAPISNKTMPIPSQWENNVLPGFDGSVMIQKTFSLSDDFLGKDLELHLGAIDDNDITYFNGVQVGKTEGYQIIRNYKVPASLVKKENVVLVVVSDYAREGGITGDNSQVYVKQGNKTVSLAGNWNYSVIEDFAGLPINTTGPFVPTVLYNAMLYPCHVMPVKGTIWYQGCANVGRADQYSVLFKRMITDWRKLWGEKMPFYFVQLAGYLKPEQLQPQSEWAALRQAQADALQLPYTGMATAIDIGNPNDIHPKNKQEVARRLALLSLKNTYGKKDIIDKAPTAKKCTFSEGTAAIVFSGKLTIKNGNAPQGFIVENADGSFSRGTATLQNGNTIVVKTDKAGTPRSVRYDWADCPDGNVYGANDLPVCPFRTDKI